MENEQPSTPPFWMPVFDPKGRPIDICLRQAAERVWPQAFRQVEGEMGETSAAAEIYESAVFAVSNVLHRNGRRSGIRDLDAYIYWAFSRKLTKHALQFKALVFLDAHELVSLQEMLRPQDRPDDIEKEILITQLVSFMDPRTKWIFLARVCGQSWASIAVDLGATINGAEVMYNRGVRTVRERIQKQASRKRKHFITTGGK